MESSCSNSIQSICKCHTCKSGKLQSTKITKMSRKVHIMQNYVQMCSQYASKDIKRVQFRWLLSKLSSNDKITIQCCVPIPDTIIIKGKKIAFVLRYDFERGVINKITQQSKLTPWQLCKDFTAQDNYMSRIAKTKTITSKIYRKQTTNMTTISYDESKASVAKNMPRAVVHYKENLKENNFGSIELANEGQLRNVIHARQSDKIWSQLCAIQLYLRPWPTNTYLYKFIAPLNEFRYNEEISYNDCVLSSALFYNDKDCYFDSVCNKLAYSLQHYYGVVNVFHRKFSK